MLQALRHWYLQLRLRRIDAAIEACCGAHAGDGGRFAAAELRSRLERLCTQRAILRHRIESMPSRGRGKSADAAPRPVSRRSSSMP